MTSRLASLLVQEGLVTPKTMADAFQRQVIYGGTLDTILLEMNALAEAPLLLALGRASALPAADTLPNIERIKEAGALAWFPMALAEKYRAVPLGVEGHVVRVLTIDPADRRALDALSREIGRAIEPVIGPEHRYVHALSLIYDAPTSARFQSLQARLARRASQAPGTSDNARPMASTPVPASGSSLAPTPASSPSFGATSTLSAAQAASAAASVAAPPTADPPPAAAAALGRAVVTDVPMPGAPIAPQDKVETPRLTLREPAAPAQVERELAVAVQTIAALEEPVDPLSASAALDAIERATDRDEIFSALCRGARSRGDYVVLFTVHAESMVGRVALADTWIDRARLASISLSLEAATPFRTAALGRASLVGTVGDDPQSGALLAAIGRRPPLPAVIVPVVLRDRTVALLYTDRSGKGLPAATTGELTNSAAAASRAFQRLILSTKGRDYRAASDVTPKLAPVANAQASKLSPPSALLITVDTAGGWRTASDQPAARVEKTGLHSAQTQIFRPVTSPALEHTALFASVERGDDQARLSADRLLALGAEGAALAVARLPGPLRIDRSSYRGLTPPLGDHGPLLSLVARFGGLALPALLGRLEDPSDEVRFYVTLAVGELGRDACLPQIGARLFDREATVRRVAIDALIRNPGSSDKTALIESLRGELPGPDTRQQRLAADALGALGDAPSIPRLIELVKHDEEELRSAAHRALVAITKQDFSSSRWRWRSWWDRHKTEDRDDWLFEGLAHASDDIRAASSEELKRRLPEHFGYHWDAPKREREDARRRWLEWFQARRG